MRFLTYNLRNAGIPEEKHSEIWNGWRFRRDAVVDLINEADPDVLALQEDSDEQLKYIGDALKHSHIAYCDPAFYEADTAYDAVLVRKTIKVCGSGAFWIADDGKRQSKIDGSICFRHASYVWLELSEAPLLVVNAHLDHADDPAVKRNEMQVFTALLNGIAGSPPKRTIVMGDFNSTPDLPPHSIMKKYGLHDAARLQGSEEATGVHWRKNPAAERIDYIWLSDDLEGKLAGYRLIDGAYRRQDGSPGHASDHSAVCAQFDL